MKVFNNIFIDDLSLSLKKISLPVALGIQDVILRYKRSQIGPFWITLNLLILGSCLSFVFSIVLNKEPNLLVPHIFLGLIFWNFFTQTINEGCSAFTSNTSLLHQIKIPYLIMVIRVMIRNTFVLLHNLILLPIIFLIFDLQFGINTLLIIPNFIIVLIFLFFLVIFLAIINSRFRDFENIVSNLINVSFYLTPVFWSTSFLINDKFIFLLNLNPFYHMIELLRLPLLSEEVLFTHYLVLVVLIIFAFIFALTFFSKYKNRIIYWLVS